MSMAKKKTGRKVYILNGVLRVTFAVENAEGELDTHVLQLPQVAPDGTVTVPLKISRQGLLDALEVVETARSQLQEQPLEERADGE